MQWGKWLDGKLMIHAQISNFLHFLVPSIHKGRKDYKCQSCSKSFSQTTNVNRELFYQHFLKYFLKYSKQGYKLPDNNENENQNSSRASNNDTHTFVINKTHFGRVHRGLNFSTFTAFRPQID